MKRQDIITALGKASGLNKTQSESALKGIECLIAESLHHEGEFIFQGIGKLKVKERAARTGRNPKTGAPITIDASKAVSFTTAKALKEALNESA